MEKVLKCYKIVISEDSHGVRIDSVSQNNCYWITALSSLTLGIAKTLIYYLTRYFTST